MKHDHLDRVEAILRDVETFTVKTLTIANERLRRQNRFLVGITITLLVVVIVLVGILWGITHHK